MVESRGRAGRSSLCALPPSRLPWLLAASAAAVAAFCCCLGCLCCCPWLPLLLSLLPLLPWLRLTDVVCLTTRLTTLHPPPSASAGVPFRETHHISGRAVQMAEERGCALTDLTLADLQTLHELFTDDVSANADMLIC